MRTRNASSRATLLLAWVMLGILVWNRPAYADIPGEWTGRRVVALRIEGDASTVDANDIAIEQGAPLTRAVARETVRRLLVSGRWSNVQISGALESDGLHVTIEVEPRVVIVRIELRGNEAISDDVLLETIRLREGSEIEAESVPDLTRAVEELYRERGYTRARVDVRLRETDDPARSVLWVEVEEGDPLRLRSISWVGDSPKEDEQAEVLSALGMSPGDVWDRRRIEEGSRAVQRALRERGYFEARVGDPSARPDGDGARLELPLRLGHHYRVQIRGEAPLERGDIEGALHLADDALTPATAEAARQRVLDLYRKHGFNRAEVRLLRTRDPEALSDARAALLEVRIVPGKQLHVLGMSFPGATHFSASFLRDQVLSFLEEDLPNPEFLYPVDSEVVDRLGLSGGSVGARRRVAADVEVDAARVWYAPTYRDAVRHIEELYRAAGFLDAHVEEPELVEVDPESALVRVNVYEGPRTLVYDVSMHGNAVLSSRELFEAARIARGDAFGYLPLDEARRRVLELYAERSYLFARVEPTVRFSPDHERAAIVFEITERFPVEIGEIRIEGNEVSDAAMIRDVLAIREGQPWRPSAARESEDRLLALGVFSSAQITVADPDLAERTKPVIVVLSERVAQDYNLLAGLSTGEGARGAFEYHWRNIGGVGLTFSFRVQLGYQFFFQDEELRFAIESLGLAQRLERRITASIALPWVPGLARVRTSLDFTHIRDNERDFGYDKNGVALNFGWQPWRTISFSVAGEIEQNKVDLLGDVQSLRELIERAIAEGDTRTQRLLRVPAGESQLGSTRLTASWDLRNSPFNPSQGALFSATAEYAHSLGGIDPMQPGIVSNFLKINGTASTYVELAPDWVLALQARGGAIAHLETNSRTYPNRAYYLGGVDTLRGFLQDQVIPEDQARLIRESRADSDPDNDLSPATIVRTGDVFYLARAELRFPITGAFHGGIFADIGNVWAFINSFDFLSPRWNAGVGLRLATPVGPIAIDLGVNLDRRDDLGEPLASFHFSIGLF